MKWKHQSHFWSARTSLATCFVCYWNEAKFGAQIIFAWLHSPSYYTDKRELITQGLLTQLVRMSSWQDSTQQLLSSHSFLKAVLFQEDKGLFSFFFFSSHFRKHGYFLIWESHAFCCICILLALPIERQLKKYNWNLKRKMVWMRRKQKTILDGIRKQDRGAATFWDTINVSCRTFALR